VACLAPLQGSTFGIPGVEQHAHFLRDVRHAEAIRGKLIENIALAGVPGQHVITVLHLYSTKKTDLAFVCGAHIEVATQLCRKRCAVNL
jgi:NADH dehydrogenase FAD-containing subunit